MPETQTRQEAGTKRKDLTVKDLIATHEKYDQNLKEWKFLMAVYEGIREIIRLGLVKKHPREPKVSYERRIQELYGFAYSKSVVEIFQHHLFKKPAQGRQLDTLGEDEIWKMFFDDADLFGNSYESTIMDIALYAAVQGHMGILVDKANVEGLETLQDEKDNRVYPYLAKYHPPAILDWQFDRDEFNRPYLSYVKLLDDDNQYRLWFPEGWEIWELPKDEDGNPDDSNEDADAVFIGSGPNPLGRIPFIWHYNFKSRTICIGASDIHEIARIDLSIVRNLSQIEQIINFAAFPMMRKPIRDAKPTQTNAPQQDDEVSVEAVLEFDPQEPESKPDWLEAKVQEPVDVTWKFILGKVGEIYRAANIGGMASTEPTQEPQSGVAKLVDFQMLNSKLVSKAINLENTEERIVEYWLRWQNRWDELKDKVKMTRPKDFDVEDLATDLANAVLAKTVVMSKKFSELLQKQAARQALPGANEQELATIDKEIEAAVKKAPEPGAPAVPEENKFSDADKAIRDRGMQPGQAGDQGTPADQNQQGSQQTGGQASDQTA